MVGVGVNNVHSEPSQWNETRGLAYELKLRIVEKRPEYEISEIISSPRRIYRFAVTFAATADPLEYVQSYI